MAPKKQAQKMSLGDFLGDQNLGSWADEMEDAPLATPGGGSGYGSERRAFSSTSAFGDRSAGAYDRAAAGGFARMAPREQLPLPSKPPYTAHLGNLPFDATGLDIEDFFTGCEVSNVRVVEDKIEHKPKGFGYVEFRSLEGLKKALDLSGTQFRNRDIRVSVADPPKDREGGREITDWTRKGPLADLPGAQRRPSERNFSERGPREYEAPGMERGGSRRSNFAEGDGKVRDFSNWERKGPLSPAPRPEGQGGFREGGRPRDEASERKNSPSWGEGQNRGDQSESGSRPPRREFVPRPAVDRQPTAAEADSQWRTKMRPDAPVKSSTPTPDQSVPSSPAAAPAALASRPKLNLAKRTVSEAQPSEASSATDGKASPFGAARPVDTAAKEREVEAKKLQAIQEKKEADDKAREERKAKAEAAAKAAAEKDEAEQANGDKKENGDGPKVEKILSRGEDADEEGTSAGQDEDMQGEIVDDKSVKPQEFTREPPKGPRAERGGRGGGRGDRGGRGGRPAPEGEETGGWRRKSSTQGGAPQSPKPGNTSEKLEEDGWSTVAPKTRGSRGRGASRAIAS